MYLLSWYCSIALSRRFSFFGIDEPRSLATECDQKNCLEDLSRNERLNQVFGFFEILLQVQVLHEVQAVGTYRIIHLLSDSQ